MSAATVIAYVGWAVILFFCGKWFIQGLRGTDKEKTQPSVIVKRGLLARTIFAWFLVVIFGLLNLAAAGQKNVTPKSNDIAPELGMLIGVSARLAGLGWSLWWVQKLGREWRQRRRNASEQKTAST